LKASQENFEEAEGFVMELKEKGLLFMDAKG